MDEGTSSPYELNVPGSSSPSAESIQMITIYASANMQDYQAPDAKQSHSTSSIGARVPAAGMPPQGTPWHSPPPPFPLGGYDEGGTLVSWRRRGRRAEPEEAQTPPSDHIDEVRSDSGDVWDVIQAEGAMSGMRCRHVAFLMN